MKPEDEITQRLKRAAQAFDPGPPPLEAILRWGRRRRLRRWLGVSLPAVALVAVGIAVPLGLLSSIGRPVEEPKGRAGAGGTLIFVSQEDDRYGLVALNPDGAGLRDLNVPLPALSDPASSPDGTRIAFSGGEEANTEPADLYVMNSDGSELRRLTFDPEVPDWEPAWSPDGSQIVFTRSLRGHASLFVIDVVTGSLSRVTENDVGQDSEPAWSPDGARIAFVRIADAYPSVYTVRPDGTGLTQLTDPGRGADTTPAWSPDGEWIAFARTTSQDAASDIYVMRVDGSDLGQLTDHAGSDVGPAWSPDGTRIAFLSNRDHPADLPTEEELVPPVARYEIRDMEVYAMRADGTEEQRLTVGARAGYSTLAPGAVDWKTGPPQAS